MKLRAKILVLLIPLVVLPLLGLGWTAYEQLRSISELKTLSQIRTLLDQIDLHVQAAVNTARANAQLLSSHNLVKQYSIAPDEEERYEVLQPPLLRHLISYQDAYPDYYEIRFLLPDGYEDLRWTKTPIPNSREEEGRSPWFEALSRSPDDLHTAFIWDADARRVALVVSKRVALRDVNRDPAGEPPRLRGYLVLTIGLDFLSRLIDTNPLLARGFLFATGADGRLLLSPDRADVGELLQPRGQGLPEMAGDTGGRGLIPAGLTTEGLATAATGATLRREMLGRPSLVLGKPLHPDLHLLAWIPEEDLLGSARTLGILVAAIILAAIAITTVLLFISLDHMLVAPVRRLGQAVQDLGRGDLGRGILPEGKDEIGDLARAFDEMRGNLRRSGDEIRHLAYHDYLTGLPNRLMFREQLGRALDGAQRRGEPQVLMFLDLDDFKDVNDTLGHEVGDLLLKEVSGRLGACLRWADYVARMERPASGNLVARLGGDEFVVLISDIKDAQAASAVATRILTALAEPFVINAHPIHIGVSIGITVFPDDGENPDTLIKNADIAMYHAKQQGKNSYQFFSEQMNARALRRMVTESKLRGALENHQFCLHYQPKLEVRTRCIKGVEALLRLNDPDAGLVTPTELIAVAEQTGIIHAIGEWVLREVCRQIRAWTDAGLAVAPVSVNVSGMELLQAGYAAGVARILANSGVSPRFLELELTESAILEDLDRVVANLMSLHTLGVRISLDNFGTGYSSLNHLRHLPIDAIKIDGSFISEIVDEDSEVPIISAMITLAHSLNLAVVAEGVEEPGQIAYLASLNCDLAQGSLFGKPMPADRLPQFLPALPPTMARGGRGGTNIPPRPPAQ